MVRLQQVDAVQDFGLHFFLEKVEFFHPYYKDRVLYVWACELYW